MQHVDLEHGVDAGVAERQPAGVGPQHGRGGSPAAAALARKRSSIGSDRSTPTISRPRRCRGRAIRPVPTPISSRRAAGPTASSTRSATSSETRA